MRTHKRSLENIDRASITRYPEIILIVFSLLVPLAAFCQNDVAANPDTLPLPQRGFQPGQMLGISQIENVNATTGNVALSIPLASLAAGPGGTSFDLKAVYNAQLYDTPQSWQPFPYPNDNYTWLTYLVNSTEGGGWNYNINYTLLYETRAFEPAVNCSDTGAQYYFRLTLLTPDGAKHALHLKGAVNPGNPGGPTTTFGSQYYSDGSAYYQIAPNGQPLVISGDNCSGLPAVQGTLVYYTDDNLFARLEITPDSTGLFANEQWFLIFPDGRRIHGTGPTSDTIINRNCTVFGNPTYCSAITTTSTINGSGYTTRTITDLLGRTIEIATAYSQELGSTDTITAPGFNGATNTWQVTWGGAASTDQEYSFQCLASSSTYCQNGPPSIPNGFYFVPTGYGISSIQLPSINGEILTYTFGYSANPGWGELNSVTTPFGEKATYQYAYDRTPQRSSSQLTENPITSRTHTYTDPSGTPRSELTTYGGDGSVSSAGTATTTDPDGGGRTYVYSSGLVWSQKEPNGDYIERLWMQNCPPGVLYPSPTIGNWYVKTEFRTVHYAGTPDMTAITDYTYDRNGNVVEKDEYDWVQHSTLPLGSNGLPNGIPSGAVKKRATTSAYAAVLQYAPESCSANPLNDDQYAYWNYQGTTWLLNTELTNAFTDFTSTLTTSYVYDNNLTTGNALTVTQSGTSLTSALTTQYGYDSYGNKTKMVDPNGNETDYAYTTCSYPAYVGAITEAKGTSLQRTTLQGWDCSSGLRTSETDPNGVMVNSTTYDAIGRPIFVAAAAGTVDESDTTLAYVEANSGSGSPLPETITQRQDLLQKGDGAVVTVKQFDQQGQLASTHVADTTSVNLNRVYVSGDSASYDAVSNPYINTWDSTVGWARRTYDQNGRVTATDYYQGGSYPYPWGNNSDDIGTATIQYQGTQNKAVDESSKVRVFQYDGLGRMLGVTEDPSGYLNYQTSYLYDFGNRLTSVTQGSQQRTFTYDAAGRLLVSSGATENGTLTYTYDLNGNLKTRTDNAQRIITIQYDALNRVTSKAYVDGPSGQYGTTPGVTYCYDAPPVGQGQCGSTLQAGFIGRLTEVYSSSANVVYSLFDNLGRIKQSSQTTNSVTYTFPSYSYNLRGALAAVTYPSGRAVTYGFDVAGRVNLVSGISPGTASTNYAGGITYWGQGTPKSMQLADAGLNESFVYDARLRPTSISVTTGASAPLLSLGYTYLPNGNPYTQTISNVGLATPVTQTYTYDGANRVLSAVEQGGSQEWNQYYGYDRRGNRSLLTSSNFIPYTGITPQASPPVHLGQTVSGPFTTNNHWTGALYDGAGNQAGTLGTVGDTATYDTENRLSTVTEPIAGVMQYYYDGDGKRVMKVVCPAGTSGCTPSTTNALTTVYVYDAARQVAAEYGQPTDAGTKYLFADALGSTRLETDAVGGSGRCTDYAPFGSEMPQSIGGRSGCYGNMSYPSGTPDEFNTKFTGKERDAETGLDFFGARYFSSAQGRWTSADWSAIPEPIPYAKLDNPQSLNLYQYSLNNPLSLRDDDGHEIIYITTGPGALKNQQTVRDSVTAILANPNTKGYLNKFVGTAPGTPDLVIQNGDLSAGDSKTTAPDGTPGTSTVMGNTDPNITTDGQSGGPIITIDNRTTAGETPSVLTHESVHAGESQKNPAQFAEDSKAEAGLAHDKRPQEQRANAVQKAQGPAITKAVKQIEKQRKKEQSQ